MVIGTRTEAERQELSGGNQPDLSDKPGRREFLPGAGRLESHTSWAPLQRLVSRDHKLLAALLRKPRLCPAVLPAIPTDFAHTPPIIQHF